jgi:hypothetical protein
MAAVLRITRGNEAYAMGRNLQVFVDGQRAGAVAWNQSTDIPISTGNHAVFVKLDWWRSASYPLEVADDQTVELAVTVPGGLALFFSTLFAASRFFGLQRR